MSENNFISIFQFDILRVSLGDMSTVIISFKRKTQNETSIHESSDNSG